MKLNLMAHALVGAALCGITQGCSKDDDRPMMQASPGVTRAGAGGSRAAEAGASGGSVVAADAGMRNAVDAEMPPVTPTPKDAGATQSGYPPCDIAELLTRHCVQCHGSRSIARAARSRGGQPCRAVRCSAV